MTKPAAVPDLHVKTVDDKVLVHDTRAELVHILNASAGRILTLCDGTRDVDEIAREFAAGLPVEPDRARKDVVSVLEEFTRLGLLAKS
jgi:Coenzyme PQQ synthesis protein D (PqqD)